MTEKGVGDPRTEKLKRSKALFVYYSKPDLEIRNSLQKLLEEKKIAVEELNIANITGNSWEEVEEKLSKKFSEYWYIFYQVTDKLNKTSLEDKTKYDLFAGLGNALKDANSMTSENSGSVRVFPIINLEKDTKHIPSQIKGTSWVSKDRISMLEKVIRK